MLYRISRIALRVFVALLWRLRAEGIDRVPAEGGAILASNHQSFLDVAVVGVLLCRRVRFMARRTLWDNRVLGAWMTRVGAVPVSRSGASRAELRAVVDLLRAGELLAVFPEGTRTRDGEVGEFRAGFSFFARRAGVPVVPVLVEGAFEAWPRGRRLPRPGRVRVRYGEPVRYPDGMEDGEVAADVRRRLLALRDGTDAPHPAPSGDGAACAPQRGEGAA